MTRFTPIIHDDILIDIETSIKERPLRMLGDAGEARENALLTPLQNITNIEDTLPVLLGSGMGHALKALLARTKGPIIVVDKEIDLLDITKLREKYNAPRIFWIVYNDKSPEEICKALLTIQIHLNDKPFTLVTHPFYQRLDVWYQELRQCINKSKQQPAVWDNVRLPRFTTPNTRILFITSTTLFFPDLISACEECQYEHDTINLQDFINNQETFMLNLLQKVTSFKPDYLLTINHSGVDNSAALSYMLDRMQVPMASWFVDNALLVLSNREKTKHAIQSPWYTIFSWDADNIPGLKAAGHKYAFHLPLGTNPKRFRPRPISERLGDAVCRDISFVGECGINRVRKNLAKATISKFLLRHYRTALKAFCETPERDVEAFLQKYDPKLAAAFELLSESDRQTYKGAIIWGATYYYRTNGIKTILPFNPLVIGDKGWLHSLKHAPKTWTYSPPVPYKQLHRLYPYCTINFNCTNMQMKGAVNQRVFDVPAAGSFVLSDWREQIDDLFEKDKEYAVYHELEEAPELIRFYLKNNKARKAIINAGRKRVLAEHTWAHRLRVMTEHMKNIYGA